MTNKTFIYSLILLFGLSFGITSCNNNDDLDGDEKIEESKQKTKLENTAKEFVDNFDSNNFKSVVEILQGLDNLYEGIDVRDRDAWVKNCVQSLDSIISRHVTPGDFGNITAREINRLYTISAFKGSFTIVNKALVHVPSDSLTISMFDKENKVCTATVTTEGKAVKMYLGKTQKKWHPAGHIDNYEDSINNSIEIPEILNVTISRDGKTKLSLVIKTDVSEMEGNVSTEKDHFDFSRINASTTIDMKFQDYRINIEKLTASAKTGAESKATMYKNDKVIMSASARANGKIISNEEYSMKDVNVEINVLNEVQLKGVCQDYDKAKEYITIAKNNKNNESIYRDNVNKANELLNIGLYYDNKNIEQAKFLLEPFYNESYSDPSWKCDPIVKFCDESSYSLENYFNKDKFKDFADLLNRMIDSYKELLKKK